MRVCVTKNVIFRGRLYKQGQIVEIPEAEADRWEPFADLAPDDSPSGADLGGEAVETKEEGEDAVGESEPAESQPEDAPEPALQATGKKKK